MKNAGTLVTSERLIKGVWGTNSQISPDTIRSYVRLLRQKIDRPGRSSLMHKPYMVWVISLLVKNVPESKRWRIALFIFGALFDCCIRRCLLGLALLLFYNNLTNALDVELRGIYGLQLRSCNFSEWRSSPISEIEPDSPDRTGKISCGLSTL